MPLDLLNSRPESRDAAITVLPLGMDERKLALLRMAFRMHHAFHYQLCSDAPGCAPTLAILDLDADTDGQLWQSLSARHPELPALLLSAAPQRDAPAPVLAKPLRVETLFPALRRLLEPAAAPRPAVPAPANDTTITPPAVAPAQPLASAPPVTPPITIERFDPGAGLFGLLSRLHREQREAVLGTEDQPLLWVQPAQQRVLSFVPTASLQSFCQLPSHCLWHQPPQMALPAPLHAYRLTSLLWQLAIWTSRGRLMRGISGDTELRLRHWPNLTRLPPIPDAMRISALLSKAPVNLRVAIRLLGVAPADLFTYLAAVHGLGLLELPKPATLPVRTSAPVCPLPQPQAAPPDEQRQGLLSRLLRKVTGL